MDKHRKELIQGASSCDPFPVDSVPSTSASLLPSAGKTVTDGGVKPAELPRIKSSRTLLGARSLPLRRLQGKV